VLHMLGMCLPYISSTFVINMGADCVESTFNPSSLRTVSFKTSNQVSTDLPQLDKMVDTTNKYDFLQCLQ
jgi:hypothetical protein